jgi:hypothetical protein
LGKSSTPKFKRKHAALRGFFPDDLIEQGSRKYDAAKMDEKYQSAGPFSE